MEIGRQGDGETRRQGDKERRDSTVFAYLLVSLSPPSPCLFSQGPMTLAPCTTFAVLLLLTTMATSATRAAEPATKPADPLTRFEPRQLQSTTVSGGKLPYRLLVPEGYDAKDKTKYPLVL